MHQLTDASPAPCPGFRHSVMFPDVEPDVLAREAAMERERGRAPAASPWQTYLQRVLPALERDQPADMAQALLSVGTPGANVAGARRHALTMRRRSVASGDVRRARFWDEVLLALAPTDD